MQVSTSETPTSPPRPPGTTIGSYEILSRIGGGGMGDVYRARHQRIGRQVALKVLKPRLAHKAEAVQRFLEEARAVSDIGHPNIIQIYDFVENYDQDPPEIFLVMELLTGEDLSAYVVKHGPLSPEQVVGISVQVADALVVVHQRNILHRDLKASNIFLLPRVGAPPAVKLLDFGAIKILDDARKLDLTGPGMALGTPWYMAPEQIMDQELDPRTDIYSLGVVLYKMLTGQVPFEDAPFAKLMVQVVRTRPPRPSLVRREQPPIPPALEAVVMCCLEKRPSDRFADMQQLRAALSSCVGQTAGPDATRDGDHEAWTGKIRPAGAAVGGTMAETRFLSEAGLRRRRALLVTGLAVTALLLAVVLGLALRGDDDPDSAAAARGPAAAQHAPDGGQPTDADDLAGADAWTITTTVVDGSTASDDPTAADRTQARRQTLRRRRAAAQRGAKKKKEAPHLKIVDPFDKKK